MSPLLFLLILACPIGMGLAMLFMGRGMGTSGHHRRRGDVEGALEELRAEQERIGERIRTIETGGRQSR